MSSCNLNALAVSTNQFSRLICKSSGKAWPQPWFTRFTGAHILRAIPQKSGRGVLVGRLMTLSAPSTKWYKPVSIFRKELWLRWNALGWHRGWGEVLGVSLHSHYVLDDDRAHVGLRIFHVQEFQWLHIWLLIYQITEDRHLVGDFVAQRMLELGAMFQQDGFDYSRGFFSVTALPPVDKLFSIK